VDSAEREQLANKFFKCPALHVCVIALSTKNVLGEMIDNEVSLIRSVMQELPLGADCHTRIDGS